MSLYKTKFFIIHIVVVLISVACFLMNGPMRGGLPIDNTVAERMHFIANNTSSWTFSWIIWMFSALGLLLFCVILSDEIKRDFRRTTGVFLVALGVAPDLTAEVLYAFVMPESITVGISENNFLVIESIASHLTGYLGNGLYNLGGLLLTFLAIRQKVIRSWVAAWGVLAWLLGLSLSVSVALNNMEMATIFTATSMVFSTLWMLLFAYKVVRPKWNT